MAHFNPAFSDRNSAPNAHSHSGTQTRVDLFDPHAALRHGRSRQSASLGDPTPSTVSGIPPLSNVPDSPIAPYSDRSYSDIPASVRARAGLPLQENGHRGVVSSQTPTAPQSPPIVTRQKRHSNQHSRRPISAQRSSTDGVRSLDFRYLVAGSSILAGLVLVGDVSAVFQGQSTDAAVCQEIVQQNSALSRDSLSQLLTVPERENKTAVRNIVSEPYCLMPEIEVRAGVKAQREAYPLAFDPNTWLVLLYEGEEYAGYAFSFQP